MGSATQSWSSHNWACHIVRGPPPPDQRLRSRRQITDFKHCNRHSVIHCWTTFYRYRHVIVSHFWFVPCVCVRDWNTINWSWFGTAPVLALSSGVVGMLKYNGGDVRLFTIYVSCSRYTELDTMRNDAKTNHPPTFAQWTYAFIQQTSAVCFLYESQ